MQKSIFIVGLFIFFLSCKKGGDASLNNRWKVDNYIKDEFASTQISTNSVIFDFTHSLNVSLELGVNSCVSDYKTEEGVIAIDKFSCTKKCCDSNFSVEVLNLIDSINEFNIEGSILWLKGNNNMKIKLSLLD